MLAEKECVLKRHYTDTLLQNDGKYQRMRFYFSGPQPIPAKEEKMGV